VQVGGEQPELVSKVATDWEAKSGVEGEARGRARLRWVEGRRSPDGGWLHGNHHRGLCGTGCKWEETYIDTIQNGA